MTNPYPYSLDNKRYQTYNYFTQKTYGQKAFKVSIDAGFTCPNRDGTCGSGGCNFCSARGSGDMILKNPDLEKQIEHSQNIMLQKWPDAAKIAYFQAYSNTHDSLENLKKLYDPFFDDDRFVGIDIATRSDCLDDEKIAYFEAMSRKKDLTIEIGLQTIHPETSEWMNRGHDLESVTSCIQKLKVAGIRTCVHIINGFPQETPEMMLETADYLAKMHPEMVKIHMLHIIKGTKLGAEYQKNAFPLLSRDEYVDIVVKQIERLPEDIVIARLTGDGMADDLLAPLWTIRKIVVTNEIDKLMVKRNTWQGKYVKER
ncbi:TIGR01212 family radical SAM protein [Erysipelothrix rhusiopathiae]|uniref:TIGR01212 family radical SAM protein n=1 Tax=Erysipelothrix rhusiopathiae TaxID=1648 RepID=UPI000F42D39E|nr:TIGR01212 family radical SAM protein [Erysipelothrix rhusiopathiae]AYV35108.1 TIGR01212 family radical SAM protein [Erysipelothrix rhusiopathiae]MDE8038461.1 TIGR01212 family radical SAM protein [Erysipelothrix rhusiopathiae]MDE8251650.1 TIGR01212 family radical SAM protein [Erysipelothrix rhusiopathiae]MDE8258307.1 TIGR01212 family radical SAM protein [Erysipelothrix rhusiopathiae]MDE8259726.1 TIGR01212 family radical SAM protein [Erysipelothrix rhusiopathiae]